MELLFGKAITPNRGIQAIGFRAPSQSTVDQYIEALLHSQAKLMESARQHQKVVEQAQLANQPTNPEEFHVQDILSASTAC